MVHRRTPLRVEKILWRRLFRLVEEGKLAIAWSSTVHAILGGMGVKGLWIVDTHSGLQRDFSDLTDQVYRQATRFAEKFLEEVTTC